MYAMHDRSASATGSPAGAPYPFAGPAPAPTPGPNADPFAYPFPTPARAQGSTSFRRVVVSPVRLLSSISRSTAEMRRTSAGTRSPVVNVTMSPGTSSFASMWRGLPSLWCGLALL